jgi:hypothetical protein
LVDAGVSKQEMLDAGRRCAENGHYEPEDLMREVNRARAAERT